MTKTAGRRSGRHRPCSKQLADDVAGTGLEVTQPADDPTGTGLAVKQPADEVASLCLEMEVGGGNAVVLATRKAGSDLPDCLPPTYRLCLSPSIPTPLICKTQFSPNLFFCCSYFYFYFPTIIRPRTPFIVLVRLTYHLLAYSQPLRSLPGGE